MNFYILFSALLLAATTTLVSTSTTIQPPPSATQVPGTQTPIPNEVPVPTGPGGGAPGGEPSGPVPPPPPIPVWTQCLQQVQGGNAPPVTKLVGLFQLWCSHYEQMIPCVEKGLATPAARNPLDNFVKLHFDPATLKTRSADICQTLQGMNDKLQCTQQNNATLEQFCSVRFTQGMHYIFGLQLQPREDLNIQVFKNIACQVTKDISGCSGTSMPGCSSDVKRAILAYYSIFTNDSCVADPDVEYTTPAPPPTRPPPHDTVIACAQKVAETLPQTEQLPPNPSPLDQLLHGLRQNCRTFEARYTCYEEELNSVQSPSFRDLWLKLTFDRANAIKAQKEFCDGFEGGVVGALNAECYNKTQPRLQECEVRYSQDVGALERQWASQRLDNVALHQEACAASLRRAFCLRNAFQLCGQTLADVMLDSELGTLPTICLSLLENGDETTVMPDNKLPTGQSTGDKSYETSHELPPHMDDKSENAAQTSVSASESQAGTDAPNMDGGSGRADSVVASLLLIAMGVLFSSRFW